MCTCHSQRPQVQLARARHGVRYGAHRSLPRGADQCGVGTIPRHGTQVQLITSAPSRRVRQAPCLPHPTRARSRACISTCLYETLPLHPSQQQAPPVQGDDSKESTFEEFDTYNEVIGTYAFGTLYNSLALVFGYELRYELPGGADAPNSTEGTEGTGGVEQDGRTRRRTCCHASSAMTCSPSPT